MFAGAASRAIPFSGENVRLPKRNLMIFNSLISIDFVIRASVDPPPVGASGENSDCQNRRIRLTRTLNLSLFEHKRQN
jgi:hypothetical protein